MEELIPSHVQKVFARVYHESRTITLTQLEVAVESHAGHGEGAEVELSAASAAVAKAVAMDTRGKTLLERVERQKHPCNMWKNVLSAQMLEVYMRNRKGAPSRKGCVVNDQMTKASSI